MKTASRKTIEKKLDKLWSEKVRERANCRCEVCGSDNVVQAHHIFPRTHKGTRWDLDNGVALCLKHHLYWAHKDAIAFTQWVIKKRSQGKIDMLQAKAYGISRWSESELDLLYREMLKCE